jgi:hypothetical protein
MYPIKEIAKIKKKDLVMLIYMIEYHSKEHIKIMIDYLIDGFSIDKAHEAIKIIGE